MNLCVRPRVDVFKVELIIGDTCTVLSFELTIERNGKETSEDFFCQPNFNDSYF